jgi:hypothetical protein
MLSLRYAQHRDTNTKIIVMKQMERVVGFFCISSFSNVAGFSRFLVGARELNILSGDFKTDSGLN